MVFRKRKSSPKQLQAKKQNCKHELENSNCKQRVASKVKQTKTVVMSKRWGFIVFWLDWFSRASLAGPVLELQCFSRTIRLKCLQSKMSCILARHQIAKTKPPDQTEITYLQNSRMIIFAKLHCEHILGKRPSFARISDGVIKSLGNYDKTFSGHDSCNHFMSALQSKL